MTTGLDTPASTLGPALGVRRVADIASLAAEDRFPALVAWAKEHARRPPVDADRPMVGHLGRDVPLEILDAAGVRPVQIVGDPAAASELGDRYVGVGTEPRSRAQFTRLVDGTYGQLHDLVISHDSTTSLRVFYALRAYRMVKEEPAFDLHLVEVLHLPVRTSAVYSRHSVADLRALASTWGGGQIEDDRLRDAVQQRNRIRTLLGRLASLRRTVPSRLSGTQMLAAVAAGWSLTAGEYESVLTALCDAMPVLPPLEGDRIFVTGSEIDDLALYELLEGRGLVIVGEDHDGGDLAWQGPEATGETDPMGALVDRLRARPSAAPRAAVADRIAHLEGELAATGAAAVLGYVRAGDDGPAWDLARYRHHLGTRGVPVLALTGRDYGLDRDEELEAAVDAFADLLRERPDGATDG